MGWTILMGCGRVMANREGGKMKRCGLLSVLTCAVASVCGAEDGMPVMRIEPNPAYDLQFGYVGPRGLSAVQSFTITNMGSATLIVVGFINDSSDLDHFSFVGPASLSIAAGEQGVIRVRCASNGYGAVSATLTLRSNAGDDIEINLAATLWTFMDYKGLWSCSPRIGGASTAGDALLLLLATAYCIRARALRMKDFRGAQQARS